MTADRQPTMPRARRSRVGSRLSARWLVGPGSVALAGLVTACSPGMDAMNPVSTQGVSINGLFNIALAISALVLLLVVGVLSYVVVRYRHRAQHGNEEPFQREGHRKLEIAWTVAPAVLLAVLFVLTLQTMSSVAADGDDPNALRVQVTGAQWWWRYEYLDAGVVTANELHLPLGQPVRLELGSSDVIHSFWVPQFGWKQDTVPGQTNLLPIRVNQAGTYDGACSEYCGTEHAWMRIRVVVSPPAEFQAWLAAQQQPAAAPQGDSAIRGQQVFASNTCVSCHTIRGTAAVGKVGPDLTHFGSRTTLGSGVQDNTPANLRSWVQDAHSVKPGVLMPAYRGLSGDDLDALVAYLEGLK